MLDLIHFDLMCTFENKNINFMDSTNWIESTYIVDVRPEWLHQTRNNVKSLFEWQVLKDAGVQFIQLALGTSLKNQFWERFF